MNPRVFVHELGMACPLGLSVSTACAAIRAGIERKMELPYRDNDGEVVVGSILSILEDGWTSHQRALELLARALVDLVRSSGAPNLRNVPLILSLPAGSPLGSQIAAYLSHRIGVELDEGSVRVLSEGSQGGYRALAEARALLHTDRHELVIVGGADSLVTASALLRLSEQRRLLTTKNSDGVIPGEAGVCLLLTRRSHAAVGAILGMGFGQELGLPNNELPLRGDGLVAAARSALAEASMQIHDVDYRVSDAAGEGYHFKEQALVIGRLLRRRKAEFPMWLIAESLGWVGAAAGLCGLAWALQSSRRGFVPGSRAIAWAGRQGGERAAVVFESRSVS